MYMFRATSVVEGIGFIDPGITTRTWKVSLWRPNGLGTGGTRVREETYVSDGSYGRKDVLFTTQGSYEVTDEDLRIHQSNHSNYCWWVGIWCVSSSGGHSPQCQLNDHPFQFNNAQNLQTASSSHYVNGDVFPIGAAGIGSYAPIQVLGYGLGEQAAAGPAARVQVPSGYLDLVSTAAPINRIVLISTYPESGEGNVPANAILLGTIASLDNVALATTTKIYVAINDEDEELVYDQGGTGFQTGWDGAGSSATVQQSPGSGVNDELVYAIDRTTDYPSEARVTVRVEAST
jgi:hypothetical protein